MVKAIQEGLEERKFDKDKKATDDTDDATEDSFDTSNIRSLAGIDEDESAAEAKRNLAKKMKEEEGATMGSDPTKRPRKPIAKPATLKKKPTSK